MKKKKSPLLPIFIAKSISSLTFNIKKVPCKFLSDLVQIINSVFGYTESSILLKSFLLIVKREYYFNSDHIHSFAELGWWRLLDAIRAYFLLYSKVSDRIQKDAIEEEILKVTVTDEGEIDKYKEDNVYNILLFQQQQQGKEEEGNTLLVEDDDDDDSSLSDSTFVHWDHSATTAATVTPKEDESKNTKSHQIIKPFHQSFRHLILNLSLYVKYASGSYGQHFMKLLGIHSSSSSSDSTSNSNDLKDTASKRWNHFVFGRHVGIPSDDVVYSSFSSFSSSSSSDAADANAKDSQDSTTELKLPEFYVSLDHGRQAVCVTIRGTLGLSDLLTNLECDYGQFIISNGSKEKEKEQQQQRHSVHAGMLRQAKLLSRKGSLLHTEVSNLLQKYDKYNLILIGHSLGAGIAALIGMQWSTLIGVAADNEDENENERFVISKESQLLSQSSSSSSLTKTKTPRNIHVYCFGPPCVVSLELSRLVSGLVTSVVYGDDFVSWLSLGLVRELRTMAALITSPETDGDNDDDDTEGNLRVCDLIAVRDEWWCWSVFKGLKAQAMNYCKLYPPGDVYWVYYKTTDGTEAEEKEVVEASVLNESFYQKQESITTPIAVEEDQDGDLNTRDETKTSSSSTKRKRLVFAKVKDVVELFNYPRFSRTMFTDHSPKNYEDAMRILRNGIK